jgi:Transposase IS66 family
VVRDALEDVSQVAFRIQLVQFRRADERIGRLYQIEDEIRGRSPDERQAVRQARAGPELESLHEWLHRTATTLSKKSELAKAIRYALSNWLALTRYRDDRSRAWLDESSLI